MPSTKADIMAKVWKEILALQGFKPAKSGSDTSMGLGPIRYAFPNHSFPLGAIHEFIGNTAEDMAASNGFVSGILSSLMKNGGVTAWVGSSRTIFPIALKQFGVNPANIIFIDVKKEKEVLWVMEEALKCEGLAAVVGEIKELDFTTSRRLQLAVEQSRVTGFVMRSNPRHLTTTACVARWQITSLPGIIEDDMPGVGFPRWNVSLVRVRNGKPGSWPVEWRAGQFKHISQLISIPQEQQKKAG